MKKRKSSRIQREADTVAVMIRQYCRINHGGGKDLCADCAELLSYAEKSLAHCPFQEGKTTCGKCQVHCYKPSMREQIREVMRTIGPRMLLTNPIMALRHAVDGLRKKTKNSS
ncbi:MAG: nitrous oxide-stimulated promoter family protein [Candidatus Electrothrix sp. ATG1]|nr:nitrous oxide-stimulated promoter family protein [Candidatus Electrothrix sp. ATG1]